MLIYRCSGDLYRCSGVVYRRSGAPGSKGSDRSERIVLFITDYVSGELCIWNIIARAPSPLGLTNDLVSSNPEF